MCALALAVTCGLASATSGMASSGKISAHLSKTSFTSSQASSVKLVCKFSKTSGSYSYALTFKKGSKWQTVKSVSKKSYSKGSYTMTAKQIFGGKSVRVGSYRLKLSADGGSKLLSFKVVKTTSSNTGGDPGGSDNPGGDPTAPAGEAPMNTVLPTLTISGNLPNYVLCAGLVQVQVSCTIHVSTGTWSNSSTSYSYQWLSCTYGGPNADGCTEISGATSSDYQLGPEVAGLYVRARVAAANAFGSARVVSNPTQSTVLPLAPENVAKPFITGDPKIGATLTANHGPWNNSPTAWDEKWERCDQWENCNPILGADGFQVNAPTYVVGDWCLNSYVRVTVTASNAAGVVSKSSDLFGPITS